MQKISASKAKDKLGSLIEEAEATREPILITTRKAKAVLIPEAEWRAIQETLHLLSIPGMCESIKEGIETPVDQCSGDSCG